MQDEINAQGEQMTEHARFFERMASEGHPSRVISIRHLEEIRADVEGLHESGLLDNDLFNSRLRRLVYKVPDGLPDAKSIIVMAVPQPAYKITFHWQGAAYPVILPPTYADGDEIDHLVKQQLMGAMGVGPERLVQCTLPLKTLATRSGLARYGRNNITYVEKLGSFHVLTAFYTDYPFDVDHWQEREALPACSECTSCIDACPTKAIAEDRFLIRADRCLTFLNEKTADHPFPEWVRPEWHNAIAGCMHCQNACPHNSTMRDILVGREEFGERDTEYLLTGEFEGERAAAMGRRLHMLGLELNLFPRNLVALIDKTGRSDR